MTQAANWFGVLRRAAPGNLLRALLVAQQLASFSQLPAVRALSALAGPAGGAQVTVERRLAPAGQRIGYPAGPAAGGSPAVCTPVTATAGAESRKYHGELHARYCDGRSLFRP